MSLLYQHAVNSALWNCSDDVGLCADCGQGGGAKAAFSCNCVKMLNFSNK